MATPNGWRGLWPPPAETLEALAAVLRKHWRAAAGSHSARAFWPAPARWLEGRVGLTRPVLPASPAPPATPAPLATGPVSLAGHHFTTGGRLIR